jgi:hypothetical protein
LPWLVAVGYRFKSEDEATQVNNVNRRIVTFDGMKDCFGSLLNKHELVRRELLAAAKPHVVSSLPALPGARIGVHIRFGDFAVGTHDQLLSGRRNIRVPERWYMDGIAKVREAVGARLPAFVYSDAESDELGGILRMPGVERMPTGNALTDMLSLSQACAIIASGSTFTAWASYLRQTPALYHRGQLHYPTQIGAASEIEWMPGEPLNPRFVEQVENRLGVVSQ